MKKFIIKYLIFLVFVVFLTTFAILKTIKFMDRVNDEKNSLSSPADKNLSISSYRETYNENSLSITTIEEKDVSYVQIKGLKDESLEANINQRLKDLVKSLGSENVYSYALGSFSNILSVEAHSDSDVKTLNINLENGEDISFSDIFTSNAPIRMMISNAFYETLAWSYDSSFDNDYEKFFDMNNRDTSSFEDYMFKIVLEYERKKDDLVYSISPSGVYIYGLADSIMESDYAVDIKIPFVDYKDYVAIYKRFLTDTSIFKNDKIGSKNIIVFTDKIFDDNYFKYIKYGFLNNDLFIEAYRSTYDDIPKKVFDYVETLEKAREDSIDKKSDKAHLYQIGYNVYFDEDIRYYVITENVIKATCTKEYFKENAFYDYIKIKSIPTGDNTIRLLNSYYSTKDLKIEENTMQYTVNRNGRLISKKKVD